jgi:hypothetical protein
MMPRFEKFSGWLLILLFTAGALASCAPQDRVAEPESVSTPFRAPTSAAHAQNEADDTINTVFAEAPPTPTTTCTDNLAFIADLSIPDGTIVLPESTMDKRWEVENNGSCNWNEKYRIRLLAGPAMGAQQEQTLFPARSGTRAVIRIKFIAPTEPGTYRSAWQAYNAQDASFGDPFFIDFVVQEE